MITWHNTKEKLPENNQDCVLFSGSNLYGPIMWKSTADGGGCWIDLWATPEAGTIITTDQVVCWTLWDEMKPPNSEV